MHIICLFFEKNENAIMYVCDSCDGRELARKKLFSQWFNEYNHSTLIIKELNVSTSFYNLFSSVILKRNNPMKDDILQYFEEQMKIVSTID